MLPVYWSWGTRVPRPIIQDLGIRRSSIGMISGDEKRVSRCRTCRGRFLNDSNVFLFLNRRSVLGTIEMGEKDEGVSPFRNI